MPTETIAGSAASRFGFLLLLAVLALTIVGGLAVTASGATHAAGAAVCFQLPDGSTDCRKR